VCLCKQSGRRFCKVHFSANRVHHDITTCFVLSKPARQLTYSALLPLHPHHRQHHEQQQQHGVFVPHPGSAHSSSRRLSSGAFSPLCFSLPYSLPCLTPTCASSCFHLIHPPPMHASVLHFSFSSLPFLRHFLLSPTRIKRPPPPRRPGKIEAKPWA